VGRERRSQNAKSVKWPLNATDTSVRGAKNPSLRATKRPEIIATKISAGGKGPKEGSEHAKTEELARKNRRD